MSFWLIKCYFRISTCEVVTSGCVQTVCGSVCGEHACLCVCGCVAVCACGSWMSGMQVATCVHLCKCFSVCVCVCVCECLQWERDYRVGLRSCVLDTSACVCTDTAPLKWQVWRHSALNHHQCTLGCHDSASLHTGLGPKHLSLKVFFYGSLNYFGKIKAAAYAVLFKALLDHPEE